MLKKKKRFCFLKITRTCDIIHCFFHTPRHFLAPLQHTTISLLYLDYEAIQCTISLPKCVIIYYPPLSECKLYTRHYIDQILRDFQSPYLEKKLAQWGDRTLNHRIHSPTRSYLSYPGCLKFDANLRNKCYRSVLRSLLVRNKRSFSSRILYITQITIYYMGVRVMRWDNITYSVTEVYKILHPGHSWLFKSLASLRSAQASK